ncbi:MAG: 2-hydroxyacid dehydrogenase [Candidatus Helarchaeota archaeon]
MIQKIFITRELMPESIKLIREAFPSAQIKIQPESEILTPDKLREEIKDTDGLLCTLREKISADLLENAPRLKVISNYAVGFDNIDIKAATTRGIMVTNTPDVLTDATADLTMALLLVTARRIIEAEDYLRSSQWKRWSPLLLCGTELAGKTLGIIGLGRIGSAVARRARGFKFDLVYHSRTRKPHLETELKMKYLSLTELLKQSDFISLHVPLTPETKHLIDEDEFNLMKPTCILINTARGAVINEAALVDALKKGKIHAAGLDVYEKEPISTDNPILSLSNVIALPHIGSATIETRTMMAIIAAKNLILALKGEKPISLINAELLT